MDGVISALDEHEKIRQLEEEIRTLKLALEQHQRGAVQSVKQNTEHEKFSDTASHLIPEAIEESVAHLVEDMRKEVDEVFGIGEDDDLDKNRKTFETQIGGIWLGRVVVLLVMGIVALGWAYSFHGTGEGTPRTKIFIGYLLAFIAVAVTFIKGKYSTADKASWRHILLGGGLAALYLITYASFLVPKLQIFSNQTYTWPALAGIMLLIFIVACIRQSQIGAGIGIFFIYYTVVFSVTSLQNESAIYYALIACPVLAIITAIFHTFFQWRTLSWLNMLALYAIFSALFRIKPTELTINEFSYVEFYSILLTICFLAFATAFIWDRYRTQRLPGLLTFLSIINAFIYLQSMRVAILPTAPDKIWIFWLFSAGIMGVLAWLAEMSGGRTNYLFQFFATMSIILLTIGLAPVLPQIKEWTVFALLGLILAMAYAISGIIIFKIISLGFLLVVFGGVVPLVSLTGNVYFESFSIPANWFCTVSVAVIFLITAWVYEHFCIVLEPEQRRYSGHWFLADTLVDVPSALMALIFASASALLILANTIFEFSESSQIFIMILVESVSLFFLGLLFQSRRIAIVAILPLLGAHTTFYALLWLRKINWAQMNLQGITICFLAIITYIGGIIWEKAIEKIPGPRKLFHNVLAICPHLLATFSIMLVISREVPSVYSSLVQNIMGCLLLAFAMLSPDSTIRFAAIIPFGVGVLSYKDEVITHIDNFPTELSPFYMLGMILITFILGERFLFFAEKRSNHFIRVSHLQRAIIVALAGADGILSLNSWAPENQLTLLWTLLAAGGMGLGAVFKESRYRWASLLILTIALAHAVIYDLFRLPVLSQLPTFAALTVVISLVSRAYLKGQIGAGTP